MCAAGIQRFSTDDDESYEKKSTGESTYEKKSTVSHMRSNGSKFGNRFYPNFVKIFHPI